MGMTESELQDKLETNGELMVAVSEFDEPLELHLHDTEIEEGTVYLQLTNGELTFDVDEVISAWYHTHSLEDLGLE
jgi:hypothetical protein